MLKSMKKGKEQRRVGQIRVNEKAALKKTDLFKDITDK